MILDEELYMDKEIDEVVKDNMLEFARGTFTDRFPDIRDGLKPVHRRIIYTMFKMGLMPNSDFRKCAQVVGKIMGELHPHGDISIYGALVRMAQDFSINYRIIEPQGNFGALNGDPPAAMRYTECKLSKYAKVFTDDLTDTSVRYVNNYDNKYIEPIILPAKIPNLLVQGVYGIGGAAFNVHIPSHNLSEVIDTTIKLMKNPNILNSDINLLPDFPTGGTIINSNEVQKYYKYGEPAAIKLRGLAYIDDRDIIISEIPYMCTLQGIKQDIIDKLKVKDIGIVDIFMECKGLNIKLIIKLNRSANPHKILNEFYEKKILERTLFLSFMATLDGRLYECDIKTLLTEWIKFRRDTVRKIIVNRIQSTYQKMHITEAIIKIYDILDEVIELIRNSESRDEAHIKLISNYNMTIIQAKAISGMKLYELSKKSKEELIIQHNDYHQELEKDKLLLTSKNIDEIIINELNDYKKTFGRPRRTKLENIDMSIAKPMDNIEYLIVKHSDTCSVSIIPTDKLQPTNKDSRVLSGWYKSNNRIDDSFYYNPLKDVLIAFSDGGYIFKIDGLINNHIRFLNFSESNKFEQITYEIPLQKDHKISKILSIPISEWENKKGDIIILFNNNIIKRMALSEIPTRISKDGIKYYNIKSNNKLQLCNILYIKEIDNKYVLYITDKGEVNKIEASTIRQTRRISNGVMATNDSKNKLVDIEICDDSNILIFFKHNGSIKAIKVSDIKLNKRNNKLDKVLDVISSEKSDHICKILITDNSTSNIIIFSADSMYIINNMDILDNIKQSHEKKIINTNNKDSSTWIYSSILI